MKRRNIKVQTPGEQPVDVPVEQPVEAVQEHIEPELIVEQQPETAVPSVTSDPVVDAPAVQDEQPKPVVKSKGLPDQSDVDPNAITRAVLTKQGYVCPLVLPGAGKE